MSRRIALAAFALALLVVPLAGGADPIDCALPTDLAARALRQREIVDAFIESPFAVGPPGALVDGGALPIAIPKRRHPGLESLDESTLLSWFERLGFRPKTTHEPSEFDQTKPGPEETRTWTFPGAKVSGDMSETSVFLRAIEFTSSAYPLPCGIRIGDSGEAITRLFGTPVLESSDGSNVEHRYCLSGLGCEPAEKLDLDWADHLIVVWDAMSGRVERIAVVYPRQH